MKVKAKLKIVFSVVLLAVVIFASVPKTYIHSLLGHTHKAIQYTADGFSVSRQENTPDCNFEKFDTPVYYTVFKFILNFLPLKEVKDTSFFYKQEPIQKQHYFVSPLRGPPMA